MLYYIRLRTFNGRYFDAGKVTILWNCYALPGKQGVFYFKNA